MSIKFNKHGLRVNNITSDNIVSSDGSKFLSEKESDLKYISNQTVQNYNWTPDWRNNVRGIDVTSFETPVNGWLSINKSSSPIFVNGNKITTLTDNGSYLSMLKFGDVVTSSSEFSYTFAPCKSEMLDWREVPTDYDIWRGAIFRNDDGSVESRDLYIPDATNWKTQVYDANGLTITKVENDKAYNGDEFVCNMQTEKIKKGEQMFYKNTALTSFTSDLSSLDYGRVMFYNCSALTSFTSDLSSLTNGSVMFYNCTALTSFDTDLSSLDDGWYMFFNCSELTEFTSDLSSLDYGWGMFNSCSNLTSFTSDLSSLRDGGYMFYGCNNLTSFTSDLSSLTSSTYMFRNCGKLTTFNADLSSLTDGYYMFYGCNNLTSFTSDLSSLTDGYYMFKGCNLDCDSIRNISETIQDVSSLGESHQLYIGYVDFAANSFVADIINKGWSVSRDGVKNRPTFFPSAVSVIDNNFYNSSNQIIGTYDTSTIVLSFMAFLSNSNLTTFDSDLSSLTDGYYMFRDCSKLTTFTSDLSSLTNGSYMFYDCPQLTTFNCDNLSSLTNGSYMFNDCPKLTSFTSDLSSLTNGEEMFWSCDNLTTFTSDLSSLTNGKEMFASCYKLTTFTSDLSSLTDGSSMFNNCSKLTTFTLDLSSLTNGYQMFRGCYNLITFSSDLSSLTNGTDMFYLCKLDAASVERILTTIPTYTSGSHTLDLSIQSAAASKFGEITGTTPTSTRQQTVSYKGWTIYVNISS